MDWTGFMIALLVVGLILSYALLPYLKARYATDGAGYDDETTTTNDYAPEAGALARQTLPAAQERATVPAGAGGGRVDVLAFDEGWRRLLGCVHLLLVGETNSGKSTAANALLSGRADTDRIVIIDPHATPDDWGGLAAIGMGRNYGAINQALDLLLAEMKARYRRRAGGDRDYAPLTIFVDELPAIMAHCKAAKGFFGELVREARKVDMRLVALTQSTRVKTLGIEGEGDVLENLTWLLLGEKAIEACAVSSLLARPAVLDQGGQRLPMLTTPFPGLAANRVNPARLWPLNIRPDDWLDDQLEPVSGIEEGFSPPATLNTANTGPIPGPNTAGNTGPRLTKGREQAIRAAAERGLSRSVMAGLIGGSKDDALSLIASVLGPAGAENALQVEEAV